MCATQTVTVHHSLMMSTSLSPWITCVSRTQILLYHRIKGQPFQLKGLFLALTDVFDTASKKKKILNVRCEKSTAPLIHSNTILLLNWADHEAFNIVCEKCYQIYIEYIMRIDVTGVSQSQCLQLISCGTYINIKRCTAEQFVLMSSINNQCFIMFWRWTD